MIESKSKEYSLLKFVDDLESGKWGMRDKRANDNI